MSVLGALYLGVLALLAVYGLHRAHLTALYLRRRPAPPVPPLPGEAPAVTVQLPIYNERTVAARLLDAVAALRWPRDRLEIQVLDDSTDETTDLVAAKVAELAARGIDARHVRRASRAGFKAGALEHGLGLCRGELVCVFDADFVPRPDFLERAAGHFADPRVGMVQLRWGHLNRDAGLLTRAQALLLDGHFAVEHGARFAAARFFNFSGTAGVWRRAAVIDAGGWQHDTLTEDLDLSYRAQLAGWRFVFVDDAEVPAELPADMAAFRSQQYRWAKGQVQVARKLLGAVLRARLPFAVKLEAFFHLTNNLAYALLMALGVLMLPHVLSGSAGGLADLLFLAAGTGSVAAFYVAAGGRRALVELPALMALCSGLALSQSRAVIEGLAGRDSEFVRTPKRGSGGRTYASPRSRLPAIELLCAGYFVVTAVAAAWVRHFATLPFAVLFAIGFAWVAVGSLESESARQVHQRAGSQNPKKTKPAVVADGEDS